MSGRQRDPAVPPAVLSPPGPAPRRAAADAPVSPAGPEPAGEAAAVPAAGRQALPGRRPAPQRGRAAQGALAEQRLQQLPRRCVSAPRMRVPLHADGAHAPAGVCGGAGGAPRRGVWPEGHTEGRGAPFAWSPPGRRTAVGAARAAAGAAQGRGGRRGCPVTPAGPPPHVSPDCVPSAAIRLVRLLSGPFSPCALH